jgi:hypothetical protein
MRPDGLAFAGAARASFSQALRVLPVGALTCGGLDAEHPIEPATVRALPQAFGSYRPRPLRQHGYLTMHSEPPRPPGRETENLWTQRGRRQLVAWFRFAAGSTQPCFTIAERATGTRRLSQPALIVPIVSALNAGAQAPPYSVSARLGRVRCVPLR